MLLWEWCLGPEAALVAIFGGAVWSDLSCISVLFAMDVFIDDLVQLEEDPANSTGTVIVEG